MKNKLFLILPVVALVGFLILDRNNPKLKNGLDNMVESKLISLQSQDFDQLVESKEVFLLDVHTPEQKHIPTTDAFIPYDKIGENLDKLPEDKNQPILVYCRSGSMSKLVGEELIKMGYSQVYDLVGGIEAYRETHVGVILTPEEVDLGTVIFNEGAETEFILTNNTPNQLKVERVTGSCACTQPSIEKEVLAPYESTVIKVIFEPSIHEDDSDMGDLVRLVFVDTDNENFEHLVGKITAKIVKN